MISNKCFLNTHSLLTDTINLEDILIGYFGTFVSACLPVARDLVTCPLDCRVMA